MLRLFLGIVIIPVTELFFILQMHRFFAASFGANFAVWLTFGVIILTGIVGAYLTRREGRDTWQKLQTKLQKNEAPTVELIEGAMILVGGVLLMTPGYLTDLLGFSLVLPQSRTFLRKKFAKGFQMRAGAPGVPRGAGWSHVHYSSSTFDPMSGVFRGGQSGATTAPRTERVQPVQRVIDVSAESSTDR